MAEREIRVLVVDDSAVIRAMICDNIAATPGMRVVGTASDGRKAMQVLESAWPDVITLDVQMPNMDGLATLEAILSQRAVPVIMVSSLTKLGARITLDALERGAIDYVAKPDYGARTKAALRDELMRKIRSAAGVNVRRILEIREERKQRRTKQAREQPMPKKVSTAGTLDLADKCIALGVSTGGPPALFRLFQKLQPPVPPIVIVQHMPAKFTESLAWRLDSIAQVSVKEAADGDVLRPDHALIAPGERHLHLRRLGRQIKVVISNGKPVSGHKPSVDVMMTSAAKIFGRNCLGVIMTGMGRDGADGCRAIRAAGGYVLGQNEASSDVYGMNKVAFVEGNVDRQFALQEAAIAITQQIKRLGEPQSAPVAG